MGKAARGNLRVRGRNLGVVSANHRWREPHTDRLGRIVGHLGQPDRKIAVARIEGKAERGFGRIVNITSGAVKAPIDVLGLSNGARSGLTGFVAGLARQSRVASRNVTINNLLPGVFDTDRIQATLKGQAAKTGKTIEQLKEERRATVPAKRYGTLEEFGQICAFLCSVHAGFIVGQLRQTEELVKRLTTTAPRTKPAAAKDVHTRAAEEQLRLALGTPVRIERARKGGRIEIDFKSEAELQRLFELLTPR